MALKRAASISQMLATLCLLAAAATMAAACAEAFAASPREAVQRLVVVRQQASAQPSPAAAAHVGRAGSICLFGMSGLALAGAVVAKALHKARSVSGPRQARQLRKIKLHAKEGNFISDLMKPRYAKAAQRDLPANAEMLGTIKIIFEVKLKRPFGFRLADSPQGPGYGVGVAEVAEEGSVPDLLKEVLEGKDSMWVQEGDELEAVNGEPCEGYQDKALAMIGAAGEEEVSLTFSRPRKGFIKVIFPDGKSATSPRAAILSRLAEKVGYDSGCRCADGRDAACWHKDPVTGEVYVLPLNVPGLVPSVWRQSDEDGARPEEGQYECWVPLRLERAPEEFAKAMQEEAEARQKQENGE